MRKFIIIALALVLTGGIAYANWCARDYVPASTLLVPFGIVDLDDNYAPNYSGYTTLLTVTNVSAERFLIHITVWDVLSTPIVDFDEVLSGYDVWSINFRDLMEGHFEKFDTAVERVGGTITKTPDYEGFWGPQNMLDPVTYDDGLILGPQPFPWGPTSNCETQSYYLIDKPQDIDYAYIGPFDPFEGCYFPYGYLPTVGAAIIDGLLGDMFYTAPHYSCTSRRSGDATPIPDWMKNFDDTQVWFYVTVDVVWFCSQDFPSAENYWCVRTNRDDNVIIGDVIYLDNTNRYSESVPAVSIESGELYYTYYVPDPNDPFNVYVPSFVYNPDYYGVGTFHGDFMPISCGTDPNYYWFDNREPLPTAWAFRYLNTGPVSSYLRVWKSWTELSYYISSGAYRYYYASGGVYVYYCWDENENTKVRGGGPSGFLTKEPNTLPWEVQEVPLTNGNFTALMPNNGWILLVFEPSAPYGVWDPYEYNGAYRSWPIQSWVAVKYVLGGYSTMLEAAVIANANCFHDQDLEQRLPNILGINYPYYWE